MAERGRFGLTGARVFLLLFFGLALALAVSTIVGSLRGWSTMDAATQTAPAADEG